MQARGHSPNAWIFRQMDSGSPIVAAL